MDLLFRLWISPDFFFQHFMSWSLGGYKYRRHNIFIEKRTLSHCQQRKIQSETSHGLPSRRKKIHRHQTRMEEGRVGYGIIGQVWSDIHTYIGAKWFTNSIHPSAM